MGTYEDPVIEQIMRTGYPYIRTPGELRCSCCDARIREDELYYDIFGNVICKHCIETMVRYA